MTSEITNQSAVNVGLGDRAYQVVIGHNVMWDQANWPDALIAGRHLVIISDDQVGPLYADKLAAMLGARARRVDSLAVPHGEASKSMSQLASLLDEILALGVDRRVMLIALGGGVIGDLVGFCAASLLRGVDFIQVPTSLLAQVDSSVGGKTGVNAAAGKNLIGAFHQPKLVLADLALLDSLPKREWKAGYAEIVKYGLLGDAAFFEWLDAHITDITAISPDDLKYAVSKSVQAKADIVAADEKEAGKRALLNLGHTFAHAFEAEAGYDGRLLHGEAVSAGLALAFGFSAHQGLCSASDLDRVMAHLARLNMPFDMSSLPAGQADAGTLLGHMRKDKKVKDGALTFILTSAIGAAFIANDVEAGDVESYLRKAGAA
ncbi:MAG: 3-dehydroquinate synthase [Candidatus Puniceispirillaceae bacterium]